MKTSRRCAIALTNLAKTLLRTVFSGLSRSTAMKLFSRVPHSLESALPTGDSSRASPCAREPRKTHERSSLASPQQGHAVVLELAANRTRVPAPQAPWVSRPHQSFDAGGELD